MILNRVTLSPVKVMLSVVVAVIVLQADGISV